MCSTLSVKNCAVLNWQKCANDNSDVWDKWDISYNLLSGSCIISLSKEISKTYKNLSSTTNSVVYITVGTIAVSSIMNASSLLSLWSMIGQLQIFFLLFLTKAYIPQQIEYWITGSKFVLNFADNIPFIKNWVLSIVKK